MLAPTGVVCHLRPKSDNNHVDERNPGVSKAHSLLQGIEELLGWNRNGIEEEEIPSLQDSPLNNFGEDRPRSLLGMRVTRDSFNDSG